MLNHCGPEEQSKAMTGVSQAKDSKITLGNPSFKLNKQNRAFFKYANGLLIANKCTLSSIFNSSGPHLKASVLVRHLVKPNVYFVGKIDLHTNQLIKLLDVGFISAALII
jgi:hypothetical protein